METAHQEVTAVLWEGQGPFFWDQAPLGLWTGGWGRLDWTQEWGNVAERGSG